MWFILNIYWNSSNQMCLIWWISIYHYYYCDSLPRKLFSNEDFNCIQWVQSFLGNFENFQQKEIKEFTIGSRGSDVVFFVNFISPNRTTLCINIRLLEKLKLNIICVVYSQCQSSRGSLNFLPKIVTRWLKHVVRCWLNGLVCKNKYDCISFIKGP